MNETIKENRKLISLIEKRLGVEETNKILTSLTYETALDLIKINKLLNENLIVEKFKALQSNFDSLKAQFQKIEDKNL